MTDSPMARRSIYSHRMQHGVFAFSLDKNLMCESGRNI